MTKLTIPSAEKEEGQLECKLVQLPGKPFAWKVKHARTTRPSRATPRDVDTCTQRPVHSGCLPWGNDKPLLPPSSTRGWDAGREACTGGGSCPDSSARWAPEARAVVLKQVSGGGLC